MPAHDGWRAPGGGATPHPPTRTGQSSAPKSQALPGNAWPSTWSLFLTPRSCYHQLHDHDLTVQCPTTAPPAPLVPRFISGERGAHFMDCYQKERSQYYVVLRHLSLCPPRLLQGLCDITTLGKEQQWWPHGTRQYRGHRYSVAREKTEAGVGHC